MKVNELLDAIMVNWRINNVLLSKLTNIHITTLSRYRNKQRNIGKRSFVKIYDALEKLDISSNTLEELKVEYENSRYKKVS